MIYSKLMCEYIIVENVNDRLKVTDNDSAEHVIIIPDARYRDHQAVGNLMEVELDTDIPGQTWDVNVNDTTGLFEVYSNEDFSVDWDTASYGDDLRDDLGYTGSETTVLDGSDYYLTATNVHLGGFYPSEPIENDDRPDVTSATQVDNWSSDTYQQQGRTGMLATKGGSIKVYERQITVLLPQDDLVQFETFMGRVAEGYSFAYYHDRTRVWDGPNDEYKQYHVLAEGNRGIVYAPERVSPPNNIWHRQTLNLIKRVAPTT